MDKAEYEYIEIMKTIRHYSTVRFANMSLFYAATAALMVGVFRFPLPGPASIDPKVVPYLKIAGVVITLVLFWYDFMCDRYQTYFRKEIEKNWRIYGDTLHIAPNTRCGRVDACPGFTIYRIYDLRIYDLRRHLTYCTEYPLR